MTYATKIKRAEKKAMHAAYEALMMAAFRGEISQEQRAERKAALDAKYGN
jgi:hypothetical protein